MICRYSFKFLLTVLFFFSCFSLCAQYYQAEDSASKSLSLGLEAYSRSDWDTAIRYFRQASSENPAYSEPFFWLIMAQISKGDYQDAFSGIDGFMLIFRHDRHAPTVLYQKGRLEFLTSKYDQAMETFSSFVDSNPKHRLVPSAYYWMAEICFATEKYDEAKRLYEFLIKSWPQSVKHEAASYRLALLDASLNYDMQRISSLEKEMALLAAQNEDLIAALIAAGLPLPESVRSKMTASLEEDSARGRRRVIGLEELIRKYIRARDIYEVE